MEALRAVEEGFSPMSMFGRLGFLLLLLLSAPAIADEVEMGRGVVCDMQKQAERLGSLINEDAEVALQTGAPVASVSVQSRSCRP